MQHAQGRPSGRGFSAHALPPGPPDPRRTRRPPCRLESSSRRQAPPVVAGLQTRAFLFLLSSLAVPSSRTGLKTGHYNLTPLPALMMHRVVYYLMVCLSIAESLVCRRKAISGVRTISSPSAATAVPLFSETQPRPKASLLCCCNAPPHTRSCCMLIA